MKCKICHNSLDESAFSWYGDGICNGCGHFQNSNNQPDKSCTCACHENKLKKSYAHDTKCCDNMNGYLDKQEWGERFDKEFPLIWFYSIGAGTGNHKNNYEQARNEILSFISSLLRQEWKRVLGEVLERIKIQKEFYIKINSWMQSETLVEIENIISKL